MSGGVSFFATTIAITTTATSILDFINGTAAGAGHTGGLTEATQVIIVPKSGNSGNVIVGDASVTADDAAAVLAATASPFIIQKAIPQQKIQLADIFLLGSAASQNAQVAIVA